MENTRKAIVQASTRLFSRVGYEATAMREVAADAGVATSLVYHYFDGKADLLTACIELAVDTCGEWVHVAVREGSRCEIDEAVEKVARAYVGWGTRNPEQIMLLGQAMLLQAGLEKLNPELLIGFRMNEQVIPLGERISEQYGETGLLSLMHARICLFGALLSESMVRDQLMCNGLHTPEIQNHLSAELVRAFKHAVFAPVAP